MFTLFYMYLQRPDLVQKDQIHLNLNKPKYDDIIKTKNLLHDKNLVRFIRWSSPKGLQDERSLRKSGDFRKAITLAKELSWGEFIKIVYADVSFWVLSIFFARSWSHPVFRINAETLSY